MGPGKLPGRLTALSRKLAFPIFLVATITWIVAGHLQEDPVEMVYCFKVSLMYGGFALFLKFLERLEKK